MSLDPIASQIQPYNQLNELRRELEGKIDKRLETHIFYWVLGSILLVLLALFGGVFNLISQCNEQNQSLKERLIHVEDKLDNSKKQ